jgi:hypothetical protein
MLGYLVFLINSNLREIAYLLSGRLNWVQLGQASLSRRALLLDNRKN